MKRIQLIGLTGLLIFLGCDITEPQPLLGCMDENAKNFEADATYNDGSCYYGPIIFINEFMASNDSLVDPDDLGDDPYDDWVELYNPSDEDIDIGGMYIADGNMTGHLIDTTDSELTTIPAGGFLTLWFDKEPEDGILHIEEKLSSGGDAIYFYYVNEDSIEITIDYVEFTEQIANVSMARPVMENPMDYFFADDTDYWVMTMTPTLGAENSIDEPIFACMDENASNYNVDADFDDGSCLYEGVFINELYENGEWIELYNNTPSLVNIAGWFITLDEDTWQIPVDAIDTEIASGGFLVLYADEDDDFPHLGEELTLNSYGGSIILYESDETTLVDSIVYDVQDDEKSWGRLPEGSNNWDYLYPSLGEANEEYISGCTDPEATNYDETANVDDGSCEYLEVQTGLFINEFLASNDFANTDEYGENDDWVEIYNPGSEAIDIGGMYVSDDLTDLMKHQIPTTDSNATTIPAGGFIVLWFDGTAEQGVLHVGTKLSSGGEDIVLTDTDGTTILDSYTYDAQTTDISTGRSPDGSDNWVTFDSPTPGASNQ